MRRESDERELSMETEGLRFLEARSKRLPTGQSIQEIKNWREREAAEGRDSSFEEYCRLHGLCTACNSEGLVRNSNGLGFLVVGMKDGELLFKRCPACEGTVHAKD
jgi:hypothetical protein